MDDNTKTEAKSIIDPKYREGYKGADDWLSKFINDQVVEKVTREKTTKVKDEDGNETETTETVETAQTRIDMDKLFNLARANHIDVAKYEEQRDRPNAPGRLRMTIGNMLRSRAKKRLGLFDLDENWVDAPAEFLGDITEATETREGHRIVKEKPKAEAEASTENAEA